MLKIAIILFIIVAAIEIYMNMDFSKEAIQNRRLRAKLLKDKFKDKVSNPLRETIENRASEGRKSKIEDRYTKAGFKINYATNVLICFILGLSLALLTGIGLKNPFMAIVFFGIGWNIPGIIATFISNKRLDKLNRQVGMFMRMVTKRYEVVGDFYMALNTTLEDFAGEEPIYTELQNTINNINRGAAIDDALHDLADRTDNVFLGRFADYYTTAVDIGTEEAKREVLGQAVEQYEEHMELTRELRKQLSELTMEAYVMLAFVPVIVVYQASQDPTYIPFMTDTLLGKFGSAVISAVWLLCFWVINMKLGAPVDKKN